MNFAWDTDTIFQMSLLKCRSFKQKLACFGPQLSSKAKRDFFAKMWTGVAALHLATLLKVVSS